MNKVYQEKAVAVCREKSTDGSRLFFHKRSKNQRAGLLGTVGGGFRLWEKIELIDTGRLMEKQARLNMEKCAEFLARMIQKYVDVVLGEIGGEMHSCRGSDRVCR